jgi:Fe-Mn family superoxide dismutase
MPHQPKDYQHLVAQCRGFLSETQLTAHFELYQGYVKKLNEIEQGLKTADRASANYSFGAYSELRRREPVAYNGTVLHELYFENLGAEGGQPPAPFKAAVADSFGSWDDAMADIKAMAGSAHGWVLVAHDGNFGGVRSHLVQSEHHVGLLPNQTILIAVDCWEHAYFADYQTKKAAYIEGLLKHVSWPAVASRWARCEALEREIAHAGA